MSTLFFVSTLLSGPKHSTSVPSSAGSAVPLSVDVNEVAVVPGPNPVPGLAVKASPAPQTGDEVDLCTRVHSLFPPTLQMVNPLRSPVTIHSKVKESPGQVGGAAVSCPVTTPARKDIKSYTYTLPSTHVTRCN